MALHLLRILAGIGAVAHVIFAFIETFRWEPATVRRIAPSWIEGFNDISLAEAHIARRSHSHSTWVCTICCWGLVLLGLP